MKTPFVLLGLFDHSRQPLFGADVKNRFPQLSPQTPSRVVSSNFMLRFCIWDCTLSKKIWKLTPPNNLEVHKRADQKETGNRYDRERFWIVGALGLDKHSQSNLKISTTMPVIFQNGKIPRAPKNAQEGGGPDKRAKALAEWEKSRRPAIEWARRTSCHFSSCFPPKGSEELEKYVCHLDLLRTLGL